MQEYTLTVSEGKDNTHSHKIRNSPKISEYTNF